MKRTQFIGMASLGLTTIFLKGNAKAAHVGGPCEGCEAVFEYGFAKLSSTATLPDFHIADPKMEISGTIFKIDGKTPASDVILYVYHTDQTGVYPVKGGETDWSKRHGYLRGWIKTNASGQYRFLTQKPAPYPGRNAPAHVHATVKEPDVNEYWIDEYLFEGDPLLTQTERDALHQRGGNGIITLGKNKDGLLLAHRDIILGRNIPNY